MIVRLPAMHPWELVLFAGVATQLLKFALYTAMNRHLSLRALVATNGLPSTYAVTLSALTTAVALSDGFRSPVFVASLVFSGIVLHDLMRVGGSVDRGGATAMLVAEHLDDLDGEGEWTQRMLPFLSVRAHRPFHVAIGLMLGVLLGLAWSPR